VKWDLKRVSNLIQIINDYNVTNKYDLTWQTYSMLKCLNQNIIDEGIIITLRN
jgi:aspartate carbamoyltransferase regulatory subunit